MKKRKFSAELNKAQKRLDGIRSISSPIDLGNGYTDASYATEIQNLMLQLEEYNTMLSNVDGLSTNLDKSEKALGEYSKCMLSEVGTKFGFDSVEYEKAGGTRKSAIQRGAKKVTVKA